MRWGAGLAWVTVAAIIANVICFGPMYNNIAPILNGGASVSPEAAARSEEVIRKVGEEGIVLAQNDGLLPLSGATKLNVFGWASTNPIYGGTGSGSSSNEGNVDILTSLKDAGFEVNQDIIDMYAAYSPTRDLGGNNVTVNPFFQKFLIYHSGPCRPPHFQRFAFSPIRRWHGVKHWLAVFENALPIFIQLINAFLFVAPCPVRIQRPDWTQDMEIRRRLPKISNRK